MAIGIHPDGSSVRVDDPARDGKAQARTTALEFGLPAGMQGYVAQLSKFFEDMFLVFGRYTDAGISDGHFQEAGQGAPIHGDLAAIRCKFDGVAYDVAKSLKETFGIAIEHLIVAGERAQVKGLVAGIDGFDQFAVDKVEDLIDPDRLEIQSQQVVIYERNINHVIHDGAQAADAIIDAIDEPIQLPVDVFWTSDIPHHGGISFDERQGRFQFVRGHGNKIRFTAIQPLQFCLHAG